MSGVLLDVSKQWLWVDRTSSDRRLGHEETGGGSGVGLLLAWWTGLAYLGWRPSLLGSIAIN